MFHTADSERRQFQKLRNAAEREFVYQPLRQHATTIVTATPKTEAIPRPFLEVHRNSKPLVKPSILVSTVTFHKKN